MKSIIGFLGRGPYSPQNVRRQYWETRYQFPNQTSEPARFFLQAAMKWLAGTGQKLDRLMVLGTSGSMWDGMLEAFCEGNEGEDKSRVEELCFRLVERVDNQLVTQEDLAPVAAELSRCLGIEVHATLIPAGKDENEQTDILRAMQQFVQPQDEVYLDVTHGYRHQPMLALGAAIFLTQVRGAKVRDILYGANDMREQDGPAPVVSLRWLLDLLDWANCARQLRVGGALKSLPRVIDDVALEKSLSEVAFMSSTNQVHQAGDKAKECSAALSGASGDCLLDMMRPEIEQLLSDLAGCQRDPRGILSMAWSAWREQDFVRTSILLMEAVTKHSAKLDTERAEEIKGLRDALCHAIRMPKNVSERVQEAITRALTSRTQMKKTQEKQLRWLDDQINR